MTGPAPDWIEAAVGRCLRDLQQPSAVALRLEWSRDDGCLTLWLWEADGTGSGFSVGDAEEGADFDVRFADFLQEQVFPETREAWGEARPRCPGHQHPARPVVLDDEAVWVCPATDERLSAIGAYEHHAS